MTVLLGLGFVGVSVLLMLWGGFVLSLLWNWYVVPILNLPPVTALQAIALTLVVGMFKGTAHDPELEKGGLDVVVRRMLSGFFYSLILLLVGWALRGCV